MLRTFAPYILKLRLQKEVTELWEGTPQTVVSSHTH